MGRVRLSSTAAAATLVLAGCGGGGATLPEETRITNGDADNVCYFDASVSRDGTLLLFQTGLNTGGDIAAEEIASGAPTGNRRLLVTGRSARMPVFVGDDRFAFLDAPDSTDDNELVVGSLTGRDRRVVATGGASQPYRLAASHDGTWLYYVAWDDESGERDSLRRVHPDGSGDQLLFVDAWDLEEIAVSRDGERIAYVRMSPDYEEEIWLAAADGSKRRKLVASGSAAAWSPDGTQLAYIADAGELDDGFELNQVFVLPLAGGEAEAVTGSRNIKNGPLIWFDDGRIAYREASTTEDDCQLFATPVPEETASD